MPLLIVIVKIQWTDKNKMLRNYNQLLVDNNNNNRNLTKHIRFTGHDE